jgi:hypothetical protein
VDGQWFVVVTRVHISQFTVHSHEGTDKPLYDCPWPKYVSYVDSQMDAMDDNDGGSPLSMPHGTGLEAIYVVCRMLR